MEADHTAFIKEYASHNSKFQQKMANKNHFCHEKLAAFC